MSWTWVHPAWFTREWSIQGPRRRRMNSANDSLKWPGANSSISIEDWKYSAGKRIWFRQSCSGTHKKWCSERRKFCITTARIIILKRKKKMTSANMGYPKSIDRTHSCKWSVYGCGWDTVVLFHLQWEWKWTAVVETAGTENHVWIRAGRIRRLYERRAGVAGKQALQRSIRTKIYHSPIAEKTEGIPAE